MSMLYCNIHYFSLILIDLIPDEVNVSGEIHLKHGIIENHNSSTTNEDSHSSNLEESVSRLVE